MKDEMGDAYGTKRDLTNADKSVIRKPEEESHLRGIGVDWRIILKQILIKQIMIMWNEFV
jgi:hypothetical protein